MIIYRNAKDNDEESPLKAVDNIYCLWFVKTFIICSRRTVALVKSQGIWYNNPIVIAFYILSQLLLWISQNEVCLCQ